MKTPKTLVKTYPGNPKKAAKLFERDAAAMAKRGYYPINQTYTPGAYGVGSFLLALLLCVVLIGILIFIFMLFVKPPGTLTVTYSLDT